MSKPATNPPVTSSGEDYSPTRDGPLRYAAYFARAKMLAARNVRYLAYTSDLGESFRPVLASRIVTGSYVVAAAYVVGDVGYNTYEEHKRGRPNWVVARTFGQTLAFQTLASLLLPAVVIHSVVKHSQQLFVKVGRFTKWGPSVLGLAVIPFLPLADHPIEHAVETVMDYAVPLPLEFDSRHLKEAHHEQEHTKDHAKKQN
eukprot:c2733_g1_i1.p1 GENE.c2733_g1_i1~~c2733_g1_i1.p1  ORF type:complete len:201 (+),score=34.57 c2733_g1_i1:84-686(+)